MGVIDKIAIDLSTKLGDKLQKSIEEKAVLRYGLFILIHNSNNTYNINWDINRNDSRNNNNIYNRCMV